LAAGGESGEGCLEGGGSSRRRPTSPWPIPNASSKGVSPDDSSSPVSPFSLRSSWRIALISNPLRFRIGFHVVSFVDSLPSFARSLPPFVGSISKARKTPADPFPLLMQISERVGLSLSSKLALASRPDYRLVFLGG